MKKKTVMIGGAVILILLAGIFVVGVKDRAGWEYSESGQPGQPCGDKTLTDFMAEVSPFFEHPDAYRIIDQKGNDISRAYYEKCIDLYQTCGFNYLWYTAQEMSFASVQPVPGKSVEDDTVVLPMIRTFTCKNDSRNPKIAVRVQLMGCCRYHSGTGTIDSVSQFANVLPVNFKKGQENLIYLKPEAWGYQTQDEGKTAEVKCKFQLYWNSKQVTTEKEADAGKFEISVCADAAGKIWTEPKDGMVYPSKKNTD